MTRVKRKIAEEESMKEYTVRRGDMNDMRTEKERGEERKVGGERRGSIKLVTTCISCVQNISGSSFLKDFLPTIMIWSFTALLPALVAFTGTTLDASQ